MRLKAQNVIVNFYFFYYYYYFFFEKINKRVEHKIEKGRMISVKLMLN